jgi:2'-5' RNA ligase
MWCGTFPRSGTPRVVWLGVTEGREPLLRVEREITARLTPLGIPEGKPWLQSASDARATCRDPAGLKSARLLDGLTDHRIGTTHIDAITLFQSKLSPKGPTYTALLHTPLGGSKDPSVH